MTCPLLPCPKKSGILEKGASQKVEEKEKLMIFKRFQCLLYSSQSHTKHRIWTRKNCHLHDFGWWSLLCASHYFPRDHHVIPRNAFPYRLNISIFPHKKYSVTCPWPWQWAQRYAMLQGPMMRDMIHIYQIRLPGPGQSHGGNTTHLCATSGPKSVTKAYGKYIKNIHIHIALLSVFIIFHVNFWISKNVFTIYTFFMLILLHIVGIEWLDNFNYCYLISNKAVDPIYICH